VNVPPSFTTSTNVTGRARRASPCGVTPASASSSRPGDLRGCQLPPLPPVRPEDAEAGERQRQPVRLPVVGKARERAAEQVEHRVERAAHEHQVAVAAARQHLARARDQVVEELQARCLRTGQQRAQLIRRDQVPPER
jgi:vacuolar-type H+-ATPase subunit H